MARSTSESALRVKRMAAHAHDILGRPALRAGVGEAELDRQPLRLALGQRDIGVDALGEGRADRLRVWRVARKLALHVAAIEEGARGLILREIAGAEMRRQPPEPALAPEVDLPEPVARGVEALDEEQILLVGGAQMRDAPGIDEDFRLRFQPGEDEGFARRFRLP